MHGVVRWRVVDLCQWLCETFRVAVSKQTMARELRAMGYRKLSARPRRHALRWPRSAGQVGGEDKLFLGSDYAANFRLDAVRPISL